MVFIFCLHWHVLSHTQKNTTCHLIGFKSGYYLSSLFYPNCEFNYVTLNNTFKPQFLDLIRHCYCQPTAIYFPLLSWRQNRFCSADHPKSHNSRGNAGVLSVSLCEPLAKGVHLTQFWLVRHVKYFSPFKIFFWFFFFFFWWGMGWEDLLEKVSWFLERGT